MARETKEERVVRGMTSQLTELFLDLKTLAAAPSSKESEVEVWAQSMIKTALGFSAGSGYVVRQQEIRGKMRFDLVVAKADKPDDLLMVVEVKKLGANLDRSDFRSGKTQLSEYISALNGTRWGLLTNGYEWRLYDFDSGAITVTTTDIRSDDQEVDSSAKGIHEAAWDLLDLTSYSYEEDVWGELSKESQALSPDSLARSLLTTEIVTRVRKVLSDTHGYRASMDGLTDKLAELLENGLDDLCADWNENKKAELDRYIRSQKRTAKRARKRKQDAEGPEATAAIVEASDSSEKKVAA